MKSTFDFAKTSLAVLPFGNFASPQRVRLIFLRNRHLSRHPPALFAKRAGSVVDKTMLAVTSEVPKDNMALLNLSKSIMDDFKDGDSLSQQMRKPQKIILDTDIGSEMTDAAALVLAATSSEIELLGVTTVTHDSVFRASVAKKFLNFLGKNDIPVSSGFGTGGDHVWEKEIIFPNGYRPSSELDSRLAHKLIIDLVNQNAGNITLVGIGTTTNIAKALEEDPELPKKISKIVLMGGIIEPPIVDGKTIPRGFEYNFCNDSASAEKIIKDGFNLTLVPGDLTFHQEGPWTNEELVQLVSINHPAVKLLVKLKDGSLIAMKKGIQKVNLPIEFAKPWVNDEFVLAYLIKPDLFETKNILVKWELPDKYPRIIPSESGYPIKLVCKTDFKKTRQFIIQQLALI